MNSPIIRDALYTSEQLRASLGVSAVTIAAWVEFNGLRSLKPGTSKNLFLGDDVIDFCIAHAEGSIKPKNAREKIALRKGNSK